MATRIATASQQAACDAVVDRVDGGPSFGTIDIRTGGQPATANAAATGTLLATLTLPDPAFGAADASGVATLDNTPVISTTGLAAGTAGWFRMMDSTGASVLDGLVGAELILNTTTISIGVTIEVVSGTVTMPAS